MWMLPAANRFCPSWVMTGLMAIVVSGCTSIPNQYPHALRGEYGADGTVVVRDAMGPVCRFRVEGERAYPTTCDDGRHGSVALVETSGVPYDTGHIRFTNDWTAQVIVERSGRTGARQLVPSRQDRTRWYTTGPRGGCYYVNANGNRTYVDRSLCGRASVSTASRRYIRGPRGSCYYINRNGNRTYVDRSLC